MAKLFKSNSKNFYSRNPINKFRSARYKNLVCSIKVFWGRKTERTKFPNFCPIRIAVEKGGVWKISRMLTFCPRSIWGFSSLVGRFSFLVESNQRSQTRLRKSSLIASGRSTNKTIPSHFILQPLKSSQVPQPTWYWKSGGDPVYLNPPLLSGSDSGSGSIY